jgi:hypothetical protein
VTQTDSDAGVEQAKKALREEFGERWSIIFTDRDRWWAIRRPEHDPRTRRLIHHDVYVIDGAATAEELGDLLREVTS